MNTSLDGQIIMQRKINPLIYLYIMIIIVTNLSLTTLSILFHYRTYYDIKGVVAKNEDDYYVKICIPIDKIKYLSSNNILKLDDVEYKYTIISYEDEYVTDNNYTFQFVIIEFPISNKYKFNNLILNLKFLKEDKRVIDYIIKGG